MISLIEITVVKFNFSKILDISFIAVTAVWNHKSFPLKLCNVLFANALLNFVDLLLKIIMEWSWTGLLFSYKCFCSQLNCVFYYWIIHLIVIKIYRLNIVTIIICLSLFFLVLDLLHDFWKGHLCLPERNPQITYLCLQALILFHHLLKVLTQIVVLLL